MLSLESDIEVGDPVRVGPVDAFPVFGPTATSEGYLTSVAGAGSGLLVCEELNPPDLGTVIATNLAQVPILLPAGTLLVGGAQSRVVSTGVLCPPRSVVMVAVSGVEARRWGPLGPLSPTDRSAPGSVRAALAATLVRDPAEHEVCVADQEAVWRACAALALDGAGDADLCASVEATAARLRPDLDRLVPLEGQTGVVCAIGSRVVGMDLFDRPAVLARHLAGIVAGHALDAPRIGPAPGEPAVDEVGRFLGLVDGTECTQLPGAGDAGGFRLEGLVTGVGLDLDGEILQLSAFPHLRAPTPAPLRT